DRRPGILIDDAEDLLERLIFRLSARPAGEPLGYRVEENYTAGDVRDDHGITDALQRDIEGFSFPPYIFIIFRAVFCHSHCVRSSVRRACPGLPAATIVPEVEPAVL